MIDQIEPFFRLRKILLGEIQILHIIVQFPAEIRQHAVDLLQLLRQRFQRLIKMSHTA